jgi:hypothetical protein
MASSIQSKDPNNILPSHYHSFGQPTSYLLVPMMENLLEGNESFFFALS